MSFLSYTIFFVGADQNATLSLMTYLKLMQFSYTNIGSFPGDFMPLNEICKFDTLDNFHDDLIFLIE